MKQVHTHTYRTTHSRFTFGGFVFIFVLMLVKSFVLPSTVSALDPNSYPENFFPYRGLRENITNYNSSCASNPNKYAITPWVSKRGDPGNPGPIRVPYGATSIDLQFNTGVFICQTLVNGNATSYPGLPNDGTPTGSVALRQNYTNVANASATDGGFSPSPVGNELEVGYNGGTRYWFGAVTGGPNAGSDVIPFTYTTAALTADKVVTVTLGLEQINHFANGDYLCVANSARGVRTPGYGCPIVPTNFTLNIDVDDPPPAPVDVTVHVFKVDSDGNFLGDVDAATLETCNGNPTITTSSNGFGDMSIDTGTDFCLSINSAAPANSISLKVRPWDSGGGANDAYINCGPYGGPPYTGSCSQNAYESQVAGGYYGGNDRSSNSGYDFVYLMDRPADGNINASSSCNDIKGTARDIDRPGESISVHIYKDGVKIGEADTSGPGNNYSFDITPDKDYRSHTFKAYAIGKRPDGSLSGNNPEIGTWAPGACGEISCVAGFSTDPPQPQSGSGFNITVNYSMNIGSRGAASAYNVSFSIPVTNGSGAADSTTNNPVAAGGSAGSATRNNLVAPAGVFSGTYTVTIQANSINCPINNITVADLPYLRVFGGDVTAGVSTGTCSSWQPNPLSPGRILAFNKGDLTGAGAGTDLVAQALEIINGFSSAQRRLAPGPEKGLSFANTSGANVDAMYGGGFGVGSCPTYLDGAGATDRPAGNYSENGDGAFSGVKYIYVEGDAKIRGNIVYAGSGGWASLSAIPSYVLVVKGNIYINKDVTNISGVFIAQPSGGSGGTIFTCTISFGINERTPDAPEMVNSCNKRLTINGAFIAKQVKFLRTNGALVNAPPASPAIPPSGSVPVENVTLYEHYKFGLPSSTKNLGSFTTAQLGIPDNSLSSIKVPRGYKVTLYENDNFTGATKVLTNDWSVIDGSDAWNDRTSSIAITQITPPPQLGLQWSYQGAIAGKYCTEVWEPSDPVWATYRDNFLCTDTDIGFRWSYAGPIAGMNCVSWNESAEPANYYWGDNYMCTPIDYGLTWGTAGPETAANRFCTLINEPGDPHTWIDDNFVCEPRAPATMAMTPGSGGTPAVPNPEPPASNNIAEVFIYSPDIWIRANGVIGQPKLGPFDSITSAPPIL